MLTTLLAMTLTAPAAVDLLPDMIVWDQYLLGAFVGTTMSSEPPAGRRALRFPTTTANKGDGPLELRGSTINGNNTQNVLQRIYRSDTTWYERLAGTFIYHSGHSHLHFEQWTHFRLRQYVPGGGVGSILRTGEKTSFCIIETTVYDNTLPGFSNPAWGPYGCGQLQGQRPGRADTYGSSLSGQYIDIEGIPDGTYWLEGEVDPNNNVVEKDETNNITRVLVNIGPVPPAVPDRYEENDSKAQVDGRVEGALNSPNLGLVNATRQIAELSMDDAEDWFRFRLHGTATAGDYIRIESPYHSGQNLQLHLMDANGATLASSTNTLSIKQLSLQGRGPGYYYVKVVRNSGANPNYMLTIEPDGNLPPQITLTSPTAGTIWVERAWDIIPVLWQSLDPELDPKTVSLFIDRVPEVRNENIPLDGYQDLRGSDGGANLNTSGYQVGKWYVIARAWDGGAFGWAISPGTATVYIKGDVDFNGVLEWLDYYRATTTLGMTRLPYGWDKILDFDRDGDVDKVDLRIMRDELEGH